VTMAAILSRIDQDVAQYLVGATSIEDDAQMHLSSKAMERLCSLRDMRYSSEIAKLTFYQIPHS